MKHSPGPWNTERPYGEPGLYVADAETGLVARMATSNPNADADARLIAAAPALLDALDVLHAHNVQYGLGDAIANEAARAAIAAATGKEKEG